jgi:zinc protease
MSHLRCIWLLLLFVGWATGELVVGQTRRRTAPPVTSPAPAPAKPAPIRGLVEQTQRGALTLTRFSNGLRLICGERYSTELVAIAARLGFGAADEPETASGVAWVVAHGLLSEADEAELTAVEATVETVVEAQGTTLTITAPARYLATAAGTLMRALSRQEFSERQLQKGQAQAAHHHLDSRLHTSHLARSAWLTLAAGRPSGVPDTEAHFKSISLETARAFHTAHLSPRRTVLAVTGNLNLVEVLRVVAEVNAGWKPEAAAAATPRTLTGRQYRADRGPQNLTWAHVGYVLPAVRDEERAALDIIRAALALGVRSRLQDALVENRQIASEVRAYLEATPQGATFCVGLNVQPERLDRAEVLTLEAIERLRRERMSDGELQRARAQLELERVLGGDRLRAWAQQLAWAETTCGLLAWLDDLDRIKELDAEQVRAVAAKYLVASRLVVHEHEAITAPPRTFTPEKFFETVGLLVPATLAVDIPDREIADAPETVVVPTKVPPKAKEGGLPVILPAEPVREYATLRGPRVLVRPDPSNPLVAIGLYFQGGRFIEDEQTAGITELMLRVMMHYTAKQPPEGILDELERLGSRLQVVNERDFFGFELYVLAHHAEAALRRLVALVERPKFDAAGVKAHRERLLAEQKLQTARPVELATWLARKSLLPSHPYGFPALGVAGTLRTLDESAVQRWYAATIQRQLPIIVIAGGTEGSALVTRDIAEGFIRRETDKALKARVAQPAPSPILQEVTAGTRDISAFALATPGGREADHWWSVFATWLDKHLNANRSSKENFRVWFAPALQLGEILVVGEGEPGDAPRLTESIARALRELPRQPPSADAWRMAAQQTATCLAEATDAVLERVRAYARAVYLGIPYAEVDTAAAGIRQLALPPAEAWEAFSVEAAGRGLVRGTRLAQPKAAAASGGSLVSSSRQEPFWPW